MSFKRNKPKKLYIRKLGHVLITFLYALVKTINNQKLSKTKLRTF